MGGTRLSIDGYTCTPFISVSTGVGDGQGGMEHNDRLIYQEELMAGRLCRAEVLGVWRVWAHITFEEGSGGGEKGNGVGVE